METLYELTQDYQALLEYADAIDPDDEQVFLDTLDGIMGAVDVKMDQYAAVMEQMEAHGVMIEREIKRLKARQESIERNQERMKERMYEAMIAMNQTKIKTDLHTFIIKKNGGQLPLIMDHPEEVTDAFTKVVYEPDKEKIRLALETGNVDALKFAHLGERGSHLEIK